MNEICPGCGGTVIDGVCARCGHAHGQSDTYTAQRTSARATQEVGEADNTTVGYAATRELSASGDELESTVFATQAHYPQQEQFRPQYQQPQYQQQQYQQPPYQQPPQYQQQWYAPQGGNQLQRSGTSGATALIITLCSVVALAAVAVAAWLIMGGAIPGTGTAQPAGNPYTEPWQQEDGQATSDPSTEPVTTTATAPAAPQGGDNPYGWTNASYYDPDRSYRAGSTFLLGKYEQDGYSGNGKEDIEWRVLKTSGGRTLAISVYGLDVGHYNDSLCDVTWETCDLRRWLNDSFYEDAFNTTEQSYILTGTIPNPDNEYTGVSGGASTVDSVFCITLDEYMSCFSDSTDRLVEPTEYAISRGAYVYEITKGGYFWLRTPGRSSDYVTYGSRTGDQAEQGTKVNYETVCVRPAIYVG